MDYNQFLSIFIVFVDKISLIDGKEYKQFVTEVGVTPAVLLKHLADKYGFNEAQLIQDPHDDFPYFTDGGFKYTYSNRQWKYTFTCFPKKLIN